MTSAKRSVLVKQLPSSSDLQCRLEFLREVEAALPQRRPCLVLDCSLLRDLDEPALHMMLHCLEAALKLNGDVKLAALPPSVENAFEIAGLERLFSAYDTVAKAVASFHRVPVMSEPSPAAVASLQVAPAV